MRDRAHEAAFPRDLAMRESAGWAATHGGSSCGDETPLMRAVQTRRPESSCDDYASLVAWQVCLSRRRTIAAAVVMVVAAVICLFAVVPSYRGTGERVAASPAASAPSPAPPVSARRLMESPELAEVAADNVLALRGGEPAPGERELLRGEAAAHFRNVSARIRERDPEAARRLEELQLTDEQRRAVLDAMRGLRDPRLSQLGREVSAVLATSLVGSSGRRATAKRQLVEYLRPRIREVRQLHDEVTPAPLRELDDGDELDLDGLDLKLDGLRLFSTIDDWNVEFEVTPGGRRLKSMMDMMFGSASSTFKKYAQADAFWEKIRKIGKKFNLDLPPFSQLIDSVDMESLMKCVMSTSVAPTPSHMQQCGMEFVTAANQVMDVCFGKNGLNKVESRLDKKLR
jgi:hypothetical protein